MRYLSALLLSICVPLAWAVERDLHEYPMHLDGRLILEAGSTKLRIQGHDQAMLIIDGPAGQSLPSPQGNENEWQLDMAAVTEPDGSAELLLMVPFTASLEISADSAKLYIEGLRGERIRAFNVAGPTEVRASRPEILDIESVQGSQIIHASGRESSRLKSISGSITAIGLGGRARLSTLTGDMTIQSTDLEELEVETVSGNISANLHPSDRAIVRLTSHDGPLQIVLPSSTPLDARLQSHLGELSSDFEKVELAAGSWRIVQAPGSVTLQARSFSAPISLRASPVRLQPTVPVLVYRLRPGPVEVAEFGHEQQVDVRLRAGEYALVSLPASTDLIYVRGDRPGRRPEHGRYELGVERWGEGVNCFEVDPSYQDSHMAWATDDVGRALLIARHFTLEHGPCPSPEALEELEQVFP